MYHDQGLPVLKYSGFEQAVNLTLGLPYPRVAVDHGTALELAGKGIADPSSLFAAVDTCARIARAPRRGPALTPRTARHCPGSPCRSPFTEPAKKHLGQHFLHDRGIIEQDRAGGGSEAGDRLVEIGPGQGAITFPLLRPARRADRDRVRPRPDRAADRGGARARRRSTVIHSDVLQVDFTALAGDGRPLRLVGNLPYNLSSPILFHALDHAAAIRDMHFMLQKEVVDRMAAGPGSKVYGRLSVMLQAYCHGEPLFDVPPGAFRPPPKVDSAVVRLVPRAPAHDRHRRSAATFARVVRAAFGQRRKTLRNALSQRVRRGRDRGRRRRARTRAPSRWTVADFIRLANRPAHGLATSAERRS